MKILISNFHSHLCVFFNFYVNYFVHLLISYSKYNFQIDSPYHFFEKNEIFEIKVNNFSMSYFSYCSFYCILSKRSLSIKQTQLLKILILFNCFRIKIVYIIHITENKILTISCFYQEISRIDIIKVLFHTQPCEYY